MSEMTTETYPTELSEALDLALDSIKQDEAWDGVYTFIIDEVKG